MRNVYSVGFFCIKKSRERISYCEKKHKILFSKLRIVFSLFLLMFFICPKGFAQTYDFTNTSWIMGSYESGSISSVYTETGKDDLSVSLTLSGTCVVYCPNANISEDGLYFGNECAIGNANNSDKTLEISKNLGAAFRATSIIIVPAFDSNELLPNVYIRGSKNGTETGVIHLTDLNKNQEYGITFSSYTGFNDIDKLTIFVDNQDLRVMQLVLNPAGPTATAPTVTTTAASSITATGAVLNGTVNANSASTTVTFEYGTSISYGTSVTATQSPVTGSTATAVSYTLTGLSPNTTYHYKVKGVNSSGNNSGSDASFTTQNSISSVNRSGSSPTNASSVSWTVTFAASLTGLTSSNFSLVNTGLTSPSITNVSGSGTTWTVTANTGTGSGSLGLNLVNSTGLSSTLSNTTFTGQVYTIDKTLPTATITAGTTAGGDAFVNIAEKALGFNVVAQSSEATGILYVVPSGTANNIDAITGAAIGSAASAGANTDTSIAISAGNAGVTNGTVYKVYAVDGVGNISAISGVAFTADLTAPTATIITGTTAGGDALVNIAEKALGFNVVAQSSEATGTLYVVPSGTANNIGAITGAAIGSATSAGANTNTPIAISAGNAGVTNGTVYKVYAVDAVGNISVISGVAFTADLSSSTVSSVSSTTENGSYKAGSNIVISITFSENITVTGTPTLTLNSGGTASYFSGSGGTILTFHYTVGSGENSSLLDYSTTSSLSLAGGTIKDVAGNNATLALQPIGGGSSLSAGGKNLVVDTTAPTVIISSTAGATTNISPIPVSFIFSESITGFVVDDIDVTNGTAGNFAGSGTTYTADITPAGQGVVNINVAGAVAADAAGNGNIAATQLNRTFDNQVPTVSSVGVPSDATYVAGQNLDFTVNFSEAVAIVTTGGTPYIPVTLNTGGTVNASYLSGTGTTAIVFRYTVVSGNEDANGISAGSAITANGGTLKDAAGNNATLTLNNVGSTTSVLVDAIAPTVTSVTSTKSDGTYGIGEAITITVTFGEAVTVTGTPQLELETGLVDRTVNYTSGTGTNILSFTYTTQSGDESSDLDYKATGSLALNSGTIKDAAGNNATLTLSTPGAAGSLGANKAIVIQAFPTVTLSVGSSSIAEDAGTSTITATLSQTSSQAVTVSLSYSGTATNGTDYNSTASTSITVPAGSLSANAATGITATQDLGPEGHETIIIDISSVTKGTESGTQQQTITILDDDIASVSSVSSTTANGSYNAGDGVVVTITFSHPVTVTGTPKLTLETGTTDQTIDYVSGSGTNTLSFNYTVQSGDNSTDLDYVATNSLVLNGGTIRNSGLDAILTLPSPGAAGSLGANKSIIIDNIAPTATVVLDDPALKAGETATVTITFSEAVTGFANADLAIPNGTLTAVASTDGNITFTATFTPTADTEDATNAVTLDNTGLADAAGNTGLATTSSANFVIDTKRPTATVALDDPALKAGETATVTITFSEAVTGFANADLAIPNGTLTAVASTDGNITFTATFTPTADTEDATNAVTLDNTGLADAAGNTGLATTSSANFVIDTKRPTATVALDDPALKAGETATVTITFSEAVTGFANADLAIPNGTLTAVASTDGNITFTATFTPTADTEDATNAVTLDNTGLADAAGNTGLATTSSANFVIDTKRPTATVALDDPTLKAGETATVTITFSEAVTGFANADLIIPNGTLTAVASTDGNITFTATFTPAADTEDATNAVTLDNTGLADAAGNTGLATTSSANFVIDTKRPTAINVTSTKSDGTYGIGEAITITVTFSKAVTVTGTPQLELETGPVDRTINYASGTGTNILSFTYTTQSGDESSDLDYKATGSLALNSGTIKDAAGNDATLTLSAPGAAGSLGANKAIVIQAFPTVTLGVGSESISEGFGTSAITATLSQVSSQDVVVSLAYSGTAIKGTDYNSTSSSSITILAGSLSANAATGITAIQDTDPEGDETIVIDISGVTKGTESGTQQQTITIVDDDAPTVTSVSVPSDGIYRATQNLDFTVTFNQPVTINTGGGTPYIPVTIGSATVNATLNGTVAGSTTALFRYTVQTGQEDTNGITVGSAIAANGATIRNTASLDAITTLNSVGSTANVKVDAIVPNAPVVTGISTDSNTAADGITNDNTLLVNGTSEPNATVEVFINTVSVGTTAANGTGNWQFDHTATVLADGNCSLTAKATDAAGNTSIASTAYAVTVDTAKPSVAITGSATSPTNSTFTATFTFNEGVYNFAIGDITVGNGSASNFSATSATVYTATITPVTNGAVTVDVAAGMANDLSGNTNTAATQYSITYDIVKPTVTISSTAVSPVKGGFTATFTFSEAVTGFAVGDITVGNGTAGTFTGTSASVYTAVITPLSDGTVTVDVNADVSQDAAGNQNTAATRYSVTYDGTVPTVAITSKNINHLAKSFTAEFTFSEPVTGFTAGDITTSAGTVDNFLSVTSTLYSALIKDAFAPSVLVDVSAGVVADAAGNTNTAATTLKVEFDETPPTVYCRDTVLYLDPSGNAAITAQELNNGSHDHFGIANLKIDKSTFSCDNLGENKVALTVTDNSGNVATCTSTVTVKDTITVITKDITVLLGATGKATITPDQIDNGSFCSCGIVSYKLDKTEFDCSNYGKNTVTLTVTGKGGNTQTGTATVTVESVNIAPVFNPVADMEVQEDVGHFNVTITGIAKGDCDGVVQQVETVSATYSGNIIEKTEVAYTAGQESAVLTIYVKGDVSGQADITIRIKDNGGTENGGVDTYSSGFKVTVLPVNDAPEVAVSTDPLYVEVGHELSYSLPAGLFTDIDEGDRLNYSISAKTGNLPVWLNVDDASLALSGTPGVSDLGNFLIKISATDMAGASASTYLEISVFQQSSSSLTGSLFHGKELLNGGAIVALYQRIETTQDTLFNLVIRTMVSSQGKFSLYNLSPGEYIVEATISDTAKYGNLMTTYCEQSPNWAGARKIILDGENNLYIDMQMLEKPVQNQGSFVISGFIIKKTEVTQKAGLIEKSAQVATGNPLAGVNVLLWQNGVIVATCISDEEGHYEFTGLPEGEYQVEVMLPGFKQQEVVAVEVDPGTTEKEEVNFTVWEGVNVITDLEILRQPVQVKVFPNPTSGKLTVDIKNRQSGTPVIRVYSITGQLVLEKTGICSDLTPIDLSGNDPGIYLIEVTCGNNKQTHRVVLK